ncbi:signal peptide peptidase SppA [soil metagenome]
MPTIPLRWILLTLLGLALSLSPTLTTPLHADEPEAGEKKDGQEEAPPKPPLLVDLTVKGSLNETPSPLGLDGTPTGKNLRGLVETIAKAKNDDKVKGMVLRLRDLSIGFAKADDLRQAIEDFRKSGKPVYAILETASNVEYLVATAADEIVMPPQGWLLIKGLAAEVTFYKGLFDKLDIRADFLQVGEYKGAAEPYTRTEMSDQLREELASVLSDQYRLLAEAIADRPEIEVAAAAALVYDGPYTPSAAKKAGLVDRVGYEDELREAMAEALDAEKVELDDKYGKPEPEDYSGLAGFMKLMQQLSGQGATRARSKAPKVAVIYASGMIQTGKSSPGSILGDAVMGSDTIVEAIRKAEEDETVKAIVLRVDSPGGSALASDLIWRALVEARKPVVASMSDVAASGGYYISMGCDKVLAEPGTLTGSIGVVGGKIAVGGLLEKVGITTDTVEIGKNGRILSIFKPFSEAEEAAMKAMMEETYEQFVRKAADGRKQDYDDLEALAGGRVYSGRKAEEIGLVDGLGTLSDAIAAARELADLGEDEEVELLSLPEPKGLLESLIEPLEEMGLSAPVIRAELDLPFLPAPVREALGRLEQVSRLLEREPAVLLLPFEVRIR